MSEVVAITGASSGIGEALALAWARRGAGLVLGGRDAGALARVAREVERAGGEAFVEPGDVTDEADRARFVGRALREKGRLDVLVNNAGRGYYGAVRALDLAEVERLFALNVFAPLRLTQLALGPLEASRGAVVMMSSVAGVAASPRMGAYAASKFALEALSVSLRAELAARGVRVVVVRPGPVDTPFRDHAVTDGGEAGVRPPGVRAQRPEAIAEQTLRGLDRGRPVVETSAFVRVASASARLAPPLFRALAARMARKGA
ncbi:MAG TPA: SDR family NAD(P)-dependent oxidoreductase [Polyangiaceae bacterium]|nr:SDR family NAD(P)-dependent oxidoreductase [Polyangiaceae bacterium]